MTKQWQSWLFDLIILCTIIGCAYFITLGIPALFNPDEGRYAEIPREMLLMHQFVVPHLDGIIYFEKPPLIYWLVAFFEHVFGYSEWSVRAVNALLAITTCLSVYLFSRYFYDRTTAYFAALTLSSSLLFFFMGHLMTLDMGVTCFLTLNLLLLFSGLLTKKAWLLYLGYAAAALVILTKGLIGLIFPMMIFGLWIIITGQWQLIKQARLISGLLIILIIALPWHILAQQQVPSFFHQYIIVQQFLRFLTPIMSREMKFWTYLLVFLASFFPWVIFSGIYLKKLFMQLKHRLKLQKEWFFLIWIFAIFLFFAFSNSILIPYLEPITPAMALFTAPYLASLWQQKQLKLQSLLIGLMLFMLLLMNFAWVIAPEFNNRSSKPLATYTHQLLVQHPNAILINYGYYNQDFPYYTQQLVRLVNFEGELSYGYSIDPNAKHIIMTEAEFWQLVNSKQVVYVVLKKDAFNAIQSTHPHRLFLLAATENGLVLVANLSGVTT